MPNPQRLALALLPALALALPGQQQDNAGFGGVVRQLDLRALTGNDAHLGVCDIGGVLYVSARDPNGGRNHVIYRITPDRQVSSFAQPALHAQSEWGMRDLCTDGVHLAGGSEAGVSILTTSGALASDWNGQPVTQPIGGPVQWSVPSFRALCWDGTANGGNGLFYTVSHDGHLVAFDRWGSVAQIWPNDGWAGHGLALDPVSGNFWMNGSAGGGDLVEIDHQGGSHRLTGRRIPPAVPGGRPGGLAVASVATGDHAPWPARANLVELVQGSPDVLAVRRLHLLPGRNGWDEVRLEVNVNGNAWQRPAAAFGPGDTLGLRLRDPTHALDGLPGWVIFNFLPEAAGDDLTDLAPFTPGLGLLVEHRSRNLANVGVPTGNYLIVALGIGQTGQIPLSPGPAPSGLIRIQALHLDPGHPQLLTSTNEAWWVEGPSQRGVLVEADGRDSFASEAGRGFWRIRHLGGVAPIRSVTLDWAAATRPGLENAVFDIDQDRMVGRLDGGNGTGPCLGTYRNGSDVLAGLDYGFPGNHVSWCAPGNHNAGFTFAQGDRGATRDLTFRFTGAAFGPGVTFEFDCDTDGGLGVSGRAMAGLVVRVTLADNTQLTGELQADSHHPFRAAVILR